MSIQKKLYTDFKIDKSEVCPYCFKSVVTWEIDHIIPLSKGGLNIEENLIYVCKPCNIKKRNFDLLVAFDKQLLPNWVLGRYIEAKELCSTLESKYILKSLTQKYSKAEFELIVKSAGVQHLKVATLIRKLVLEALEKN